MSLHSSSSLSQASHELMVVEVSAQEVDDWLKWVELFESEFVEQEPELEDEQWLC